MGSSRTLLSAQHGHQKAAILNSQYVCDGPSDDEDSPEYFPHSFSIKSKAKAQSSNKVADKREKNRLKQRKYRARQTNMIESLQSDNQGLRLKNQALLDHTKELQELISELRKENQGSKTASCVPTYQTDFQGGIVSSPRRRNGRTEAEQIHRGANIDMGVAKDGSPREWQAETFLGDKNHSPSSSCSSSPLIPSNGSSSPEMSFAFNSAEPCLPSISENHLWTDPYELDEFQLYRSNHHDQLDCHSKYPISTLDEESTMQTQPFDGWYSLGSDQRSSEYSSGLLPSLFNRNIVPALTTTVTTLSGSSYTREECGSNEPTYALPPRQIHSKTSIDTSTISPAISRYMTEFEHSKNILGLSQMEPSVNFENNQHLGRTTNDEMSTSTTMSFGLMSPPTQARAPAPVPMKVGMLTRGRKQAGYRH